MRKKIIITFFVFIFIFLFENAKTVKAQTGCIGSLQCYQQTCTKRCNGDPNGKTCSIGNDCGPGGTCGLTCNYSYLGVTYCPAFDPNTCNQTQINCMGDDGNLKHQQCSYASAAPFCGDGVCNNGETTASCPGDCPVGGGGGGPVAPPAPGSCGSCSGCYAPNPDPPNGCALINGVCSKAGYCGGAGAACNVEFNSSGIPSPFTVGVPVSVDVFVRGGSQWYDGIWGWGTCTDTNCTKAVYDTNLGDFNPRVFASTPYRTTFIPKTAGLSYIHFYAQDDNGGKVECQGKTPITVLPAPATSAWWQAVGGDVITNGNLLSAVPQTSKLILDGVSGIPGNATYGIGTNITTSSVSNKGWLGNSSYLGKTYDSSYFSGITPPNVVVNTLPALTQQSDLSGQPASVDGYIYLKKTNGTLNLNTPIVISGNEKVVIFAGSDVNINGNITIANPGQGFLLIIASGNINVDPRVTTLNGLFETDGSFVTGTGTNQLSVKGSVVAWGGVTLQRNLNDNSVGPAETFTHDPTQVILFPRSLIQDNVTWQEVIP